MLLPSAAVRAALKLNTAEKRYAWAAEQLHAALFPSPAVVADPTLGIPAKPINKGIVDTKSPLIQFASYCSVTSSSSYFDSYFYLPFDLAQYHRGVPLLRCIGTMTNDIYLPNVGSVPAGEPILDNSVSKTFEQYLVEQAAIIITTAGVNFNFSDDTFGIYHDSFQVSEFQRQGFYLFELGMIFNRTPIVGTDRYSSIGTFDPI